ncbi:Gamma-glutamylputrescine oxidoreductase [Lasiodiplodia hormozganensis]|uniref:Gamma-glutamylputrescine oxidoreductase n=1 Tax=Lasiodiplodia hormozganensis TaxID=869390 RepID=A0AA39XRH0_9PEZI|nr:Gamma-glutamylputrescine oxidoreductase [Lasiodiplodia hormozganensis]
MSGSPEGIYEPGIVDPGLPVPHPTKSFWLSSLHQLANHQSPWPTHTVDVAIIGSGITGTNIARTLLQKQPNLRIVVLEARSLCSGATGRNGGHIKTMSFASWEERKATYGIEEAVRITEFEHSHLDALERAARENAIDCELVRTEGVDAYFDQATFDRACAALEDMRAHAPQLAAKYTVYTDPDRLHRVMKLSPRCVGAIGVPAASVWPYKLVTGLMARMIESGKLNVQTHTTVTSIDDDDDDNSPDFAAVHTTRGTIRARRVVHATNGWLGHLLPELRPFVSPVRGNVVRYAPSSSSSSDSTSASPFALSPSFSLWLRYAAHDYDYLIQRAADNSIVVGRANTGRRATGDDSQTDLVPMAHLRGFAGEVLAAPASSPAAAAAATIDHAWSGILAFVQDASPFIGPLPGGRRQRQRQWVCGAYNGVGMVRAFRAAEMVAGMLVDEEELADEYPRSMLVTEERLGRLKASLEECGAGLEKPRL